MNSLNANLKGKMVRLRKEYVAENVPEVCGDPRFQVDGGDGADPQAIGILLTGTWVHDGAEGWASGIYVDAIVTEAEKHA